MNQFGLDTFQNKRLLLLQGPMGPFFYRFAKDLREAGATVHKINFNGGDWLLYPTDAVLFRGTEEEWPSFLEHYLETYRIEIVLLFGDCRPYHRVARAVAKRLGVTVGVFEEGYIRPDYVTFEYHGVNGHSRLPQDAEFYHQLPKRLLPPPKTVGKAFWHGVLWSMIYFAGGTALKRFFPHYQHHRPLKASEGFYWIRSLYRKYLYAFKERGLQYRLETELSGRYFLVPLQVYNDAQISVHSEFKSVADFIRYVMESFLTHAPKETILVFKHHPLDRGYRNYANLIQHIADAMGGRDRVLYLHDQHLPTLLKHVRGVVVINSTVGLSALHHGAPLKVCGKAIYAISGLTHEGSLDSFWSAPTHPDPILFKKFRNYLIEYTQINGNFYRRLHDVGTHSGLAFGPVQAEESFEPLDAAPLPAERTFL